MLGGGTDVFAYTAASWGGDTVTDFDDGADRLRFKRFIADTVSDFLLTGNAAREVTLAIGVQTLILQSDAPITLTNADFQFLA